MKRNQLLLLLVPAVALLSAASAEIPYPVDVETSVTVPTPDTYVQRHARLDEATEIWGVGRRPVMPPDAFPFGGGYIDD